MWAMQVAVFAAALLPCFGFQQASEWHWMSQPAPLPEENEFTTREKEYRIAMSANDYDTMKEFIRQLAEEQGYIIEYSESFEGFCHRVHNRKGRMGLGKVIKMLERAHWVRKGKGKTAPLTDNGFDDVTRLKSQAQMIAYARRVLASERKQAPIGRLRAAFSTQGWGPRAKSFDRLKQQLMAEPWVFELPPKVANNGNSKAELPIMNHPTSTGGSFFSTLRKLFRRSSADKHTKGLPSNGEISVLQAQKNPKKTKTSVPHPKSKKDVKALNATSGAQNSSRLGSAATVSAAESSNATNSSTRASEGNHDMKHLWEVPSADVPLASALVSRGLKLSDKDVSPLLTEAAEEANIDDLFKHGVMDGVDPTGADHNQFVEGGSGMSLDIPLSSLSGNAEDAPTDLAAMDLPNWAADSEPALASWNAEPDVTVDSSDKS